MILLLSLSRSSASPSLSIILLLSLTLSRKAPPPSSSLRKANIAIRRGRSIRHRRRHRCVYQWKILIKGQAWDSLSDMRVLVRAISCLRVLRISSNSWEVPKDFFHLHRIQSCTGGSTSSCHSFGDYSSIWRTSPWRTILGLILSGQSAILICSFEKPVYAEEVTTAYNDRERDINGLRPVEDASVISNIRTSKWRVFTDRGRELFLEGKLDEAEMYFQLALQEAKEGFGATDPHVASSLNNLAEFYRVRKHLDKAEPLYVEAINILEVSYGAHDIRVAAAHHNLGQFYLLQRKFESAQGCYEHALKIKGRVIGDGNPDYADTMYHLGVVVYLQGKEKDAQSLIKESIKILEENGQGETKRCIRRMRYLAQILVASGQHDEAEALQRKISHILDLTKVSSS